MNPAGRSNREFSLWDLTSYLRPHTWALAAAGSSMAARAVILMLAPWPLKFTIDNVILRHPLPAWFARYGAGLAHSRFLLLDALGIAALALGLADASFNYFGTRWILFAGQRAIFYVRRDLFAHVQRLSMTFHRHQRSGELMARFGGDIQTLQEFVVAMGTGIFVHFLTIVGMALVMFWTDWRFALVALGVVPLLLVVARRYTTLLTRSMRVARRREGALWGLMQETLAGVHLVQAYGREAYEDERFVGQASASLNATLHATELQVRFVPLVQVLMAAATGLTLWYGATRVLSGSISAGELLVFLAYLRGMAAPVRQLAKVASVIGKASVARERLAEIFSQESEVVDAPDSRAPSACRGELEFRQVSFAYGAEKAALHDVSFQVSPGETVALVGRTGAGKTTLLSLVMRFHDPLRGELLLDGRELRTLPLAFVRDQVALVLQDALLFGGAVWENIAYGRPGATRDDAIAASRAVGVHDVIESLRDGYDTEIGERGATLSGGQRQCIAIARAMLRDARIVLLDEPTSGLDAINERRVMDAIRHLTEHRTTLIIAHRLSTVREADRILVVDRGQIVEAGPHDFLFSKGGIYASLFAAPIPKEVTIA